MEPISFRPLHDHVIIFQPNSSRTDRTAGGLYRPDSAKKWDDIGIVVAVGPGRVMENAQREIMEANVGARVIFASHILMELEHLRSDAGRYGIVRDRDIHAEVEGARRVKTVETRVSKEQELSDPPLPESGIVIHSRDDSEDGICKLRVLTYSYDFDPAREKTIRIPTIREEAQP